MTASSTYVLQVRVPSSVWLNGKRVQRSEFLESVGSWLADLEFLGMHEGTVLSEEASRSGFETESWTIDAGMAPQDRDWVGEKARIDAEWYFSSRENAESAADRVRDETDLEVVKIYEQEARDWNEEWKKSFRGIELPPYWRIYPPHLREEAEKNPSSLRTLWVNPGAGFGTGTHETTQLILTWMGEREREFWGAQVLDFGSGSGILSIGAALLGAQVTGVEIDPLAIENAEENTRLNEVQPLIRYSQTLDSAPGPFDFVIANIIRSVLEEFAPELKRRIKLSGKLILSGVTESDLPSLTRRYSDVLGPSWKCEKRINGDWCALIWSQK